MKRHKHEEENVENVRYSSHLQGHIVPTPKTDKEKKDKFFESQRNKLETDLEMNYLDDRKKIHPRDLGVINNLKIYPDEKKPDRRYKRGVETAKADLQLLSFLLENLKTRYKNQILNSNEMRNIMHKCSGISDITSINLTKDEEKQVFEQAMQMLVDSLTVIKKQMPIQFHDSLKDSGKPFFALIDAIANYDGLHIHISDAWKH